jgi:protein TonB
MLRDDLFNKEWCDIIFDGKNKSYGAYIIRKSSAKRHTIALIWVLGAVAAFFLLPSIIIKIMSLGSDDELNIAQVTSLSKLQKPPVIKIKEVKPKIDLSPKEPDAIKDKDLIKQIKFVAPLIANDNEVTQQDINKGQAAFDHTKLDLLDQKKDTAQYALPEELLPDIKPDETMHYEVIDNMPEFPGGQQALMLYLSTNIKYPFWAQRYNMQGQVTVQFIVNVDGSLSDCRVIKGAGVYLDNEALRVIRSMPKWSPAKKKGKPVKSRCVLPVIFRLN